MTLWTARLGRIRPDSGSGWTAERLLPNKGSAKRTLNEDDSLRQCRGMRRSSLPYENLDFPTIQEYAL